jgi:hypothetical protein
MNLRIRRRRFGQLAVAVTAAIANLESKAFAQQSEQLYGVLLSSTSSSKTEDSVDAAAANITPAIVIQSIDLTNLATAQKALTAQETLTAQISEAAVTNQQEPTETVNKALVVNKPSERITGFTVLSDNTFVISTVAASKNGDFSRLIFNEAPQNKKNKKQPPKKGLKVKKIKNPKYKYSTVESLLATTIKDKKDNQLLSVISLSGGGSPFELAFIDSNSGQIDTSVETGLPQLSPNERLSNFAQSPDGKIYATSIGGQGSLGLVQLDLENRAVVTGRGKIIRLVQLSLNKKPMENDLASLAFSSSGQLFALADPNYEGTNSLFTVDVKTGVMALLRKFAVDKITFARV